jgi:glutaredoxin
LAEIQARIVSAMTKVKFLFFSFIFLSFSAIAQVDSKVNVYTTSWCPYCQQAKAYLESVGVTYTDNDIEQSIQAREAYKSLNGKGIPLVFIGNSRFDGYDPVAFEEALISEGLIKSQNENS